LAAAGTPGSWLAGRRLVAIDGTTLGPVSLVLVVRVRVSERWRLVASDEGTTAGLYLCTGRMRE
jgi:hypothetical protein